MIHDWILLIILECLVQMEERIKKKRHKIMQAKTGSPNPMKVIFNK
jgi:hypothetical protein